MNNCEARTANFYVPKDCKGCFKKGSCKTFNIYKEGMAQGFVNKIKEAKSKLKFKKNNKGSYASETDNVYIDIYIKQNRENIGVLQ